MAEIPLSTNKLLINGQEITASENSLYFNGSIVQGSTGAGGGTTLISKTIGTATSIYTEENQTTEEIYCGKTTLVATEFKDKIISSVSSNAWPYSKIIYSNGFGKIFNDINQNIYGTKKFIKSSNEILSFTTAQTIFRSTDGVTWTNIIIDPIETIYDIYYDGQIFVACGSNGFLAVSEDGSTWSKKNSGTTDPLQFIAHRGNILLVFSSSGVILKTENHGEIWSVIVEPSLGGTIFAASATGDFFILITSSFYYTSVDGSLGSWVQYNRTLDGESWDSGSEVYPTNLQFFNNKLFLLFDGSYSLPKVYESVNGYEWNSVLLPDKIRSEFNNNLTSFIRDYSFSDKFGLLISTDFSLNRVNGLSANSMANIRDEINLYNNTPNYINNSDKFNFYVIADNFRPSKVVYVDKIGEYICIGNDLNNNTGIIYKSTDLKSWVRQDTAYRPNTFIDIISWPNSADALGLTSSGQLVDFTGSKSLLITDLGFSPTSFCVIPGTGNSAYLSRNSKIFVVGTGGLLKTGYNNVFGYVNSSVSGRLNSISYNGRNSLVAVGDRGIVTNSYDGGSTWTSGNVGYITGLSGTVFLSDNCCYTSPTTGAALYKSSNGQFWGRLLGISQIRKDIIVHPTDPARAIYNRRTTGSILGSFTTKNFDPSHETEINCQFNSLSLYSDNYHKCILNLSLSGTSGIVEIIPVSPIYKEQILGLSPKLISPYIPNIQNSSFTGLSGYASLNETNQLRTAYENLRVLTEQLLSGMRSLNLIRY